MSNDDPLANRLPGYSARHATRRARRLHRVATMSVVAVLAVVAGVLLAAHFNPFSGTSKTPSPATTASSGHSTTTAAGHAVAPATVATAAAEPWTLAAPLSGSVVLPGSAAGQLVIMGGATSGNLLADGIFVMNTANGALTQVGDLTSEMSDGAGAQLGGQLIVFGGATPGAQDSVQGWAMKAPGASASAVSPATALGSLPAPIANATAVVVGPDVYLVGGDNGTTADPAVLETTNGTDFSSVANLPVPVRSAAAAVVGHKLYVFGGVAMTGADAGQPVATIQVVNLKTHKTSIAGRLPKALAGATAASVGTQVVIIGGDTLQASTAGSVGATPSSSAAVNATTGTSATIWSFDTKTRKVSVAAALPTPVAYSGTTIIGSTVWLVGGETNGMPVAVVQTVTLSAHS